MAKFQKGKIGEIHICPDLDIIMWLGRRGVPLSDCKQMEEREKEHQEMNANLECHIYKDVQYCFCSLKTKINGGEK